MLIGLLVDNEEVQIIYGESSFLFINDKQEIELEIPDLTTNNYFIVGKFKLYAFPIPNFQRYQINQNKFTIGNSKAMEIVNLYEQMHCQICFKTRKIITKSCSIIINRKLYQSKNLNKLPPIKNNDELIVEFAVIIKIIDLKQHIVEIGILNPIYKINKKIIQQSIKQAKEEISFDNFKPSPQTFKSIITKRIIVNSPPESERKQKLSELFKRIIPIIISVGITIFIFLKVARNIYFIGGIITTCLSIVLAIISYVSEKKEIKTYNQKREQVYKNYLEEQAKEIEKLRITIQKNTDFNCPNNRSLIECLRTNKLRIYERTLKDNNYLEARIGMVAVDDMYEIEDNQHRLEVEENKLELLKKQYVMEYRKPLIIAKKIDLKTTNLGIISEKQIGYNYLQNLILNIVLLHSYENLKLIFLTTNENQRYFQMFRFLKHLTLVDISVSQSAMNSTFILTDVHQVELFVSQLVNKCLAQTNTHNTKPRLLFVVDNLEMLENLDCEKLFNSSKDRVCSLIQITSKKSELLEHINTIIEIRKSIKTSKKQTITYNFKIAMEKNQYQNKNIIADELFKSDELELLCRELSMITHQTKKSQMIPNSLGLFALIDTTHLNSVDIFQNWANNNSFMDLKCPIGVSSNNHKVIIDLHEEADGPHGIIAGTTGSGKSEFLQTLILSLAINYSPVDLNFFIIDFKGGAIASELAEIPHIQGIITNLDVLELKRAIESLKGEITYRQQLLKRHNVIHIHEYQKMYLDHQVDIPLPKLIIVCDEFAELKTKYPEYMQEIISIARIGRSLGFQLLLATQKPGGIIDEQILTNTNFRVCLKVGSQSDSRDVIKTDDAAKITVTGRGYLSVGNNERYELFQSAYTKTLLAKPTTELKQAQVMLVNENRQIDLIKMSKKLQNKNSIMQERVTELSYTSELIKKCANTLNFTSVRKIWNPALLEYKPIDFESLIDANALKKTDELNLNINLGVVDIPKEQKQLELSINLAEKRVIGIFGTTQSGKTQTCMTMLLLLASQNSSQKLQIQIIDQAVSELHWLKRLNHVANYLLVEDVVRIRRLFKQLESEVIKRKQVYLKQQTLDCSEFPIIILVVDCYESLKEIDLDLAERLNLLVKKGAQVNIFSLIIANQSGSLKYQLASMITTRLQFYTLEKAEVIQTVGYSDYQLQSTAGRFLINLKEVVLGQVYYLLNTEQFSNYIVNELSGMDAKPNQSISTFVHVINQHNPHINESLAEMPEEVKFKKSDKVYDQIFIGYSYETYRELFIEYNDYLIVSANQQKIRIIIHFFLEQFKITKCEEENKNLRINILLLEIENTMLFVEEAINIRKYSLDKLESFIQDLNVINKQQLKQQIKFLVIIAVPNKVLALEKQSSLQMLEQELNQRRNYQIVMTMDLGYPQTVIERYGLMLNQKVIIEDLRNITTFSLPLINDVYNDGDAYLVKGNQVEKFKIAEWKKRVETLLIKYNYIQITIFV
ncbi:MAG: FtsK/SpoIIIE domain-containing protein [Mycoplasmatales bacterium]